MAFPWVYSANFEPGDNSEWDSETDTAGQLDFPSYRELARFPWGTAAPYRGAYCMRLSLTGGTADATLTEGDIDIADNTTRWFRFYLWFSPDFDATSDDTVHLFEIQSTGPAIEGVFGFRYVATTDVINLGIGETAPTSFTGLEIEKGVWYAVELNVHLDEGTENDGTIDLYVTRDGDKAAAAVAASQVGSLNQAAVIQGVLGAQNQLATTTGTILIDEFVMDDLRIYPHQRRFDQVVELTKTGHVFVGPGRIENITLLSGAGTDNVLTIWDTDSADTNGGVKKLELKNTANNETVDPAGVPVEVSRGAYIELSGTDPRALVKLCGAVGYGSPGAIRSHGLRAA